MQFVIIYGQVVHSTMTLQLLAMFRILVAEHDGGEVCFWGRQERLADVRPAHQVGEIGATVVMPVEWGALHVADGADAVDAHLGKVGGEGHGAFVHRGDANSRNLRGESLDVVEDAF